jgi:hypothetical protein
MGDASAPREVVITHATAKFTNDFHALLNGHASPGTLSLAPGGRLLHSWIVFIISLKFFERRIDAESTYRNDSTFSAGLFGRARRTPRHDACN